MQSSKPLKEKAMLSDALLESIEIIAATSSKTAKEGLIGIYSREPEFMQVVTAALNPFVTYGIAKTPWEGSGDSQFSAKVWETLDSLAKRELTGSAAQKQLSVLFETLTPKSGELLKRILTKDLRAGFSKSTVNKVVPKSIPTFDCQLAEPFAEKRVTAWPVAVEPKLDGVRVLTFVNTLEGTVKFYSRSGNEFTTFDHLKAPALHAVESLAAQRAGEGWTDVVLDAEVISGSFNKTVSEVRRSSGQAVDAKLFVFDILQRRFFEQDDKGVCVAAGTYLERREMLDLITQSEHIKIINSYMALTLNQVHNAYKNFQEQGLEGAIVKEPLGYYSRRRTFAWMKLKAEDSLDLEVIGSFEGTGKYLGMLGGLVVKFGGNIVNVGSGLSDEQRKTFWEDREQLLGRLIEVGFHEVTPDKSLRHPRFVRFRDDK